MNQIPDDFDWSVTTYDGARREQLRRALALTLRERLQAVEDMSEVAERFRQMRETGKFSTMPEASEAPVVQQTPPRYNSSD